MVWNLLLNMGLIWHIYMLYICNVGVYIYVWMKMREIGELKKCMVRGRQWWLIVAEHRKG